MATKAAAKVTKVSPATIKKLAERLRKAGESGVVTTPIRDEIPVGDVAAAYAIQNLNTQYWIKARRRVVAARLA